MAELGTIAGLGMIVAFALTIVLLPALLVLLRAPQAGMKEIGFTMLAPVDDLVHRHRRSVLLVAGLAAIVACALLPLLRFDFNPLNLKSPKVEVDDDAAGHAARSRLEFSTPSTFSVPSLADAVPLARRLADLPEVSRVVSLNTFVPEYQKEKLALIGDAVDVVVPVLDVEPTEPPTRRRAAAEARGDGNLVAASGGAEPGRGRRRLGPSSG